MQITGHLTLRHDMLLLLCCQTCLNSTFLGFNSLSLWPALVSFRLVSSASLLGPRASSRLLTSHTPYQYTIFHQLPSFNNQSCSRSGKHKHEVKQIKQDETPGSNSLNPASHSPSPSKEESQPLPDARAAHHHAKPNQSSHRKG